MLVAKVVCVADAAAIIALILNNYQIAAVGLIVLSAVPLYRLVEKSGRTTILRALKYRSTNRQATPEDTLFEIASSVLPTEDPQVIYRSRSQT